MKSIMSVCVNPNHYDRNVKGNRVHSGPYVFECHTTPGKPFTRPIQYQNVNSNTTPSSHTVHKGDRVMYAGEETQVLDTYLDQAKVMLTGRMTTDKGPKWNGSDARMVWVNRTDLLKLSNDVAESQKVRLRTVYGHNGRAVVVTDIFGNGWCQVRYVSENINNYNLVFNGRNVGSLRTNVSDNEAYVPVSELERLTAEDRKELRVVNDRYVRRANIY